MGSSLGMRPEPRFTRHLKGVPLDELFELGEAVEALAAHPGWAHVIRLLEAEVAEIDRYFEETTTPLPAADYAMAHGRRGGLRGAPKAVEAILHVYRAKLEEQRARHERGADASQEALA